MAFMFSATSGGVAVSGEGVCSKYRIAPALWRSTLHLELRYLYYGCLLRGDCPLPQRPTADKVLS